MKTEITCSIGTTDPSAKLGLEIWIDDLSIFKLDHITQTCTLTYEFVEDDADHVLRFVMTNKTQEHTKVDADGNIISDACLVISDLAFNGDVLPYLLGKSAIYTHNFNGNGEEVKEKFYGTMGCNGTVSIGFSCPIYIWQLENM